MTRPAVVRTRWIRELQELQSDRKETQPVSCKCGVLLDGAPLSSLLELEERRCCEDTVLRQ